MSTVAPRALPTENDSEICVAVLKMLFVFVLDQLRGLIVQQPELMQTSATVRTKDARLHRAEGLNIVRPQVPLVPS